MAMVLDFAGVYKQVTATFARFRAQPLPLVADPLAWRAALSLGAVLQPQTAVPAFVADCPLATRIRVLLHPLAWDACPERPLLRATTKTPYPGKTPEPRAPYLFFLLCGSEANYLSHAKLARFLREHPSLLWLAGLRLEPDASFACGFDPEAAAPTDDRLRAVLRDLDPAPLAWLRDNSVGLFQKVPEFAQTVAGDTKHIVAWVKENNPKCYVEERYDKTRQPKGDRDCKLGVKSRRNRPPTPTTEATPASATPKTVADEIYWGYASGVVSTPLAEGLGDVVLAELTGTFDHSDISYFPDLMAQTVRALGFTPKNGAWDAAFDAFYVHDWFHDAGGIAAVPLNLRGQKPPRFHSNGAPLCPVDLPMVAKFDYLDEGGLVPQTKTRYVCPLLYPEATGEACDHEMFAKGGCTSNRGASPGATLRYTLDRESEAYKQIYRQRSSVERINAQAVALGIERPKLRNFRSIRNRNTLIYILLNLQTFQRLKARKPAWVASGTHAPPG